MTAVRFSHRFNAFVIVDRDGMQCYDDDGRPLVFVTRRHASKWLERVQFARNKSVDTLRPTG